MVKRNTLKQNKGGRSNIDDKSIEVIKRDSAQRVIELSKIRENITKQAEIARRANSTKSLESYVSDWKELSHVNPYTSKKIDVSLYPYDEYTCLYKHFIEEMANNIVKNRTNKVLSVDECYRIKNSLPNIHALVILNNDKHVYYDYLFIFYFVKSKTIKYDPTFQRELPIYLDLAVYNTTDNTFWKNDDDEVIIDRYEGARFTRSQYNINYLYKDLFLNKNYLIKIRGLSDLSLCKLTYELCIDIQQLMVYMRGEVIDGVLTLSKITNDVIDRVNFNMEVLVYCQNILINTQKRIKIRELFLLGLRYYRQYLRDLRDDLISNPLFIDYDKKIDYDKIDEFIDIYDTIFKEIQKVHYIGHNEYVDDKFNILISIYKSILKLYNNNKNNAIYKDYVKDLSIDKGVEPHIPQDLQEYKKLSSLKGIVKDVEKEKELKKQLMDYEKKRDVYERIYEGKYSPKQRKELLSLNAYKRLKKDDPLLDISNRNVKSESNRRHRIFYNDKRSLSTISDKKKRSNSSSYKEVEGYYMNEIDPYTQEEFSNMNLKKQKYASDIIYNDGKKEYHYRFDTVSIYNYILKCIDTCEKPNNIFNRAELTDAHFKEICTKIKYFTKKPTYSYTEITKLLAKCDESKYDNQYNNLLRFKAEVRENILNLYLYIKLGDISFKVLKENVLSLPLFIDDPKLTEEQYNNLIYYILEVGGVQYVPDRKPSITYNVFLEVLYKLKLGMLTSNRFFPYRKNKPILFNLPQFSFKLTDEQLETVKRLKRYKKRIENL
jgi:hypothetical protein